MSIEYNNLIKKLLSYDTAFPENLKNTEASYEKYMNSVLNGESLEYKTENDKKLKIVLNLIKSFGINIFDLKEMTETEFKQTKANALKKSYILNNIEKCRDIFNLDDIDYDKNWLLFVRTILGECGFTVYVRTKSTKKRDKNYYLISPVKELFKYV
jgi:hypothetical protein